MHARTHCVAEANTTKTTLATGRLKFQTPLTITGLQFVDADARYACRLNVR